MKEKEAALQTMTQQLEVGGQARELGLVLEDIVLRVVARSVNSKPSERVEGWMATPRFDHPEVTRVLCLVVSEAV